MSSKGISRSRVPSTVAAITLALWLGSAAEAARDPAATCEAAKLRAAGKNASCLTSALAKVALGKPGDVAKCDATLEKSFAKAEDRGDGACATAGDGATIGALVGSCIDEVAAALDNQPPPPSCPQLPATGQTLSYEAERNDGIPERVAVPDDGAVRAGGALRYTDHGDGTITDENTGLMWEKKSDDGGLHDQHNAFVWEGNGSQETIWDWLEDVNAEGGAGFAGHDDWRVPNVKELASLLDLDGSRPTVDPALHTGCTPGCTVTTCSCTIDASHWTSTTFAATELFAWDVGFDIGFILIDEKAFPKPVRLVRGGS
jgi:hypothetical protein